MKWAILAVLAAAVAATFFIDCDDGADAPAAGGGRRPAVVVTAKATSERVTQRVTYPGELDADTADVAAVFAGRVEAVAVRVGDRVELGAELARIQIVDLAEQKAEAEASLVAARAAIGGTQAERAAARRDAERFRELVDENIVSRQEADVARAKAATSSSAHLAAIAAMDQAEARVALLARRETESALRAPFAGRVAERYVDPGNWVAVGTRIARLVATGPLRVRFEVPEHDADEAKVGAKVDVRLPAFGDATATAIIMGIAGEVLRDRRVVMVEALVDPTPESWMAGMYAEAAVAHKSVDDRPVVPEAAVLSRITKDNESESGVFVHVDGKARWTPVAMVAREGGRVALQGDLQVGAEVLITGHTDLSDGAPIAPTKVAASAKP